jgi:type I restriction enzyme S subunit
MNEWKEYKLGELLTIKYGKDHKQLSDGIYPVYGSGGIMRYGDRYLYDKESILIPRKGSLNNIFFEDKAFWTVDTMFWSEIDSSKVCPKFLYYQLTLVDFENLNVGSAVPSLTIPIINDVDVVLPSLPTQHRIAAILSSLDDKIDLLRRENATLEAMAETLFRQWFVVEAKEEWEEGTLAALIDIGSGKGLQRADFVENGQYPVLGANGEIGRTDKFLVDESDRIVFTGRVGTLGNVFRLENKKVWLSDNTLVIKPKEYYNFVYFVLKLSRLQDYNVGSTQPLIRQSDIKEIELALPNRDILNAFEKECDLIYEKVENNNKQIQTLIQTRDGLLPKLMSNEIKI